ncbi:MAG: TetR/AcrR family transcriptional regulator [Ignavibacteriaceae bacterium]|nr:TetR/AcrR family transcriptional regulator [Ignavibacteriaceae bacterium]
MSEKEILTRKERERAFRRQEIMNAAKPLFASKGFNQTTLEEIAESAEFGKGTLYNYFENKEEIYFSVISEFVSRLSQIIDEAIDSSESFVEYIQKSIRDLFHFCIEDQSGYILFVREYSKINTETIIKDTEVYAKEHGLNFERELNVFRQAAEDGIICSKRPERTFMMYRMTSFSTIHNIIVSSCHKSTEEINIDEEIEIFSDFILNGIIKHPRSIN